MRKLTIALILALLIMPCAFAIELNTSSSLVESRYADLYVSVLKYEPYPVSPGEYFDLWLQIENKGLTDANNVVFTLNSQYPFSIDSSENAERTFANISSHSNVVAKYKVRVAENAVEGDSLLDYSYTMDGRKSAENQISISIQTLNAILSVEDVKTSPEIVAPGEKANITITLRNNADSYLKYVTASLQLVYSSTSAAGTTFIELPFTPVGGGNEKTIYQIAPKQKFDFNFQVVPDPGADSKPYKIPVNINYFDELGKNYTKMDIVGVIVGGAPDMYAIVDSIDLQGTGQSGEVTIKFVNKGTSPVKFLNANLKESKDYTIVSSPQSYLGKIDSDDYDTTTFKIYLRHLKDGKAILPISYDYMDSNNNKYSVESNLTLEIHSATELGKGNSGLAWIIIAIIIIVAVYFAYRRWFMKRRKKTAPSS